jgi:pantoate--beta-alanine ligase
MTLLVHSLEELQFALRGKKNIGFVPTMGALHEGHASLMKECRAQSDTAVMSVFVNPTQFGPTEDLAKYPRTLDADFALASREKLDIVFAPTVETIYPRGWNTFIEVEGVTEPWCGKFRPGHFRGVATVVHRLFSLVRPQKAFFGQKDLQQCLVLQRMVTDLGLPIELIIGETVRETDGLALSSRNRYLSPEERAKATVIFRALQAARAAFDQGERGARILEQIAFSVLQSERDFQTQYCELRSFPDLLSVEHLQNTSALAIAGYLGKTRLIDNTILER